MTWQSALRTASRWAPFRPAWSALSAAIKRAIWRRRRRAYLRERQDPMITSRRNPADPPAPGEAARSAPRILVVMNGGIGNAIEATPLVYALRAVLPAANLTLLGPGGDLFDDWPIADSVLRAHEELAGKTFDRTFITYAAREDLVKGANLGSIERFACLHDRWLIKPEREYNLDLARRLGYSGPIPPLYVSTREPNHAPPSAPVRIGLAPGGKLEFKWRNKRWPYFEQLTAAILERFPDAQVCILGSRDDEPEMKLPKNGRIADLRGRLSLRETAWVFRTSALAIGNDCGPMHIADAVNCPSAVIFGPTCELKNGPLNRAVVLSQEVACRPCQFGELLMTCNNPICMRELAPDAVLRQAALLLDACKGTAA